MAGIVRLERQVTGALSRAGYSGNDTTLVVAVSGGPDSSALLYCLHRLRERHGLRLHLAHLDHNFRGEEAAEDAGFVRSLALELGLPATVEKRDPLGHPDRAGVWSNSSFEQAARETRYAFLAEVARDVGAAAVAVGHTADDLAETVLLHILRGAGIHGLRGMTEMSAWPWPEQEPNLRLFRPLLAVTKTDTVEYCNGLGRGYREDTANYSLRFTRNRLRHQLLPLLAAEYNPRVADSLVRLARTAAVELDYLDEETGRVWLQVADEVDGSVRFDRTALVALHPLLQSLVLRRGYSLLMGDTRRLRERHLTSMRELVARKSGGATLDLPGGLRFLRAHDYLFLSQDTRLTCPFPPLEQEYPLYLPSSKEAERVTYSGPWRVTIRNVKSSPAPSQMRAPGPIPGVDQKPSIGANHSDSTWSAHLDRASLAGGLLVRQRLPGDRFQPLGMVNHKKLQDFFTDARVPRPWRDRVPLMVTQQGIAWVVGYRIANWAKVAPGDSGELSAVVVTFDSQS